MSIWCYSGHGGGYKLSSTFYLGVGEWLERSIASQLGHTLLEVVALVNMWIYYQLSNSLLIL